MRDELHRIAKESNSPDDWRNYRAQRNKVNNINRNNKRNYYFKRLNSNKREVGDNVSEDSNTKKYEWVIEEGRAEEIFNDKTMWRTAKNLTGNNKQNPPRQIAYRCNAYNFVRK